MKKKNNKIMKKIIKIKNKYNQKVKNGRRNYRREPIGQGSTFTIRLPARIESATAPLVRRVRSRARSTKTGSRAR